MKAAEYQYKRVYVCMRCGLRMTSVVRMHTQIYKLTRYSHLQEYIQYMNSITFILYIMSYCLYEIQPKNRLEKIQNNSYLKIKWNKIEQNRNMTNMNQCDALSLSFAIWCSISFLCHFYSTLLKYHIQAFYFIFWLSTKTHPSIYLFLSFTHLNSSYARSIYYFHLRKFTYLCFILYFVIDFF